MRGAGAPHKIAGMPEIFIFFCSISNLFVLRTLFRKNLAGGLLLELLKGGISTEGSSLGVLLWGTALSAVVGYFSLALLVKALKGKWFWLFGPYCIGAGLLTLCFCK